MFSGVLLTGEVLAFGSKDSGGTTDFYDLLFEVTGGQLAPFYAGSDVGVSVTSESSSFMGNCRVDFDGEAKGTLGRVPLECDVEIDKTCCIPPPPSPPPGDFNCSDAKPIASLTLIWDGADRVNVVSEGGEIFDDVQKGDEISFSTAGLGNDVDVILSGAVSGNSRFHVSCSDPEMNGPEDCGSAQGNGKDNKSGLNDWIFEGMAGDLTLDCTP